MCFLFIPLQSWALLLPALPQYYVNDYARLISGTVRNRLEEQLAEFERNTSNQILVATFPNLQERDIESFGIALAEKWKPGQSGRDNGAILIVSKADRKVRIEVGYGLEGVLPDAVCKAIIQNEIIPAFKQGNFDAGISEGVAAILKATAGEYKGIIPKNSFPPLLLMLLILIAALGFFFLLGKLLPAAGYTGTGPYRPRSWGGMGGFPGRGSGTSGGGSGGWSGTSGGGFSSGGGGFGGGGASGSW
ncbi:MAG TPA: hypothetical protein DF383_05155 [Deltaproteobacteria bacterium]|nr:hypothetical protein [Deltaproteobacteria bacterium]